MSVMISHKSLFSNASQALSITSKLLSHRLIISYRIYRDLTKHFLKWIILSVNRNLVNNFHYLYIIIKLFVLLIYLSILVISYSHVLSSILVFGNRAILLFWCCCCCLFFVYVLREVKHKYIIICNKTIFQLISSKMYLIPICKS